MESHRPPFLAVGGLTVCVQPYWCFRRTHHSCWSHSRLLRSKLFTTDFLQIAPLCAQQTAQIANWLVANLCAKVKRFSLGGVASVAKNFDLFYWLRLWAVTHVALRSKTFSLLHLGGYRTVFVYTHFSVLCIKMFSLLTCLKRLTPLMSDVHKNKENPKGCWVSFGRDVVLKGTLLPQLQRNTKKL